MHQSVVAMGILPTVPLETDKELLKLLSYTNFLLNSVLQGNKGVQNPAFLEK